MQLDAMPFEMELHSELFVTAPVCVPLLYMLVGEKLLSWGSPALRPLVSTNKLPVGFSQLNLCNKHLLPFTGAVFAEEMANVCM